MLQSRARLLRTALLATALTTAIAVPAAAQPAAPAGSTIDAKRVKPTKQVRKAGDSDFDYSIEAGRRGQSLAEGTLRWRGDRVINEGTLDHEGRGRGTVAFRLRVEDEDNEFIIRRFVAFGDDDIDTDFRVRESIDRIVIVVCHIRFGRRFCERERFFPDKKGGQGKRTVNKRTVNKRTVDKGSRKLDRGKTMTMVKPRSAGRVIRVGEPARTHRPGISRDLRPRKVESRDVRSRKVESRDVRSRKVESRTFKSRKVESRKVESRAFKSRTFKSRKVESRGFHESRGAGSRGVESRKVHRTSPRGKVLDESRSHAGGPLVHQR